MGKRDSVLLLGALALAGCSGTPSGNSDDIGEVSLAVTNAPADASCLRLKVTGSRNVTRSFDLMPGQDAVFTVGGLPLGTDTFKEDAFALACSQVTSTSAATWTSDPTTATLQAGVVTNLTVVLHRNGTANITSDFQDDSDAGTPPACTPPQVLCMSAMGTACIDVANDPNNCGGCGNFCGGTNGSATCTMGACSFVCNPGFSDCDGNAANGCESNVQSDPNNCGGCGNSCGSTNGSSTCAMGVCSLVCNPGFVNCDLNPATGCEINVQSDPNNCGGCGNLCGSTNGSSTCAMGACSLACNPGFSDCDGNAANGCESNVQSDPNNCGGCGNACSGGTPWCQSATCTPPPHIVIGPQPLTFPTTPVGVPSTALLQLTNNGFAPLVVTGAPIIGLAASDFHLVTLLPFTVPPGGFQPLNITFTPTMSGFRNALIIVQSNDPVHPQMENNLSGTGQ